MKLVMFFILFLLTTTSFGKVFKCQESSGDILYQDSECSLFDTQKEISIQLLDPKVILQAQEKLHKQLLKKQEAALVQQKLDIKKQEIKAIRERAKSNAEIEKNVKTNADEINKIKESKNQLRPLSNYYLNNQYYNPNIRNKEHKHREWSGYGVKRKSPTSLVTPNLKDSAFNPPFGR